MKRVGKWALPGLALLVPLSFLPALAGDDGAQPPPPVEQRQVPRTDVPQPQPAAVQQAKEKAELIKQGQLNLRDATALAEKHIKGTALEATCTIEMRAEKPAEPMQRGPAVSAEDRESGKRLVYRVSCFADDKVHMVRVDGLTKQVESDSKQREAGKATPPQPEPARR